MSLYSFSFASTEAAYAHAAWASEVLLAPDPNATTSSEQNQGMLTSLANAIDPLHTELQEITDQLEHARQFQTPDISDESLVGLVAGILEQHGSVPVGRMGSLLHDATNNHSLPAMIKERYGGLKRFLENHKAVFAVGTDHPYNPHVSLRSHAEADTAMGSSNTDSSSSITANARTGGAPNLLRPGTNSSSELSSVRSLSPQGHANGTLSPGSGAPGTDPGKRRSQRPAPATRVRGRSRSGSLGSAGGVVPMPQLTTVLAMGVDVRHGMLKGSQGSVARVVVVNYNGEVVFDRSVQYSTAAAGIAPAAPSGAPLNTAISADFRVVQMELGGVLKNRVIAGHGVALDMHALGFQHPARLLRDTATFQGLCPMQPLPLKRLVRERLGIDMPSVEHDAIENARAVLSLYKSVRKDWEQFMAHAIVGGGASFSASASHAHQHHQQQTQQQSSQIHYSTGYPPALGHDDSNASSTAPPRRYVSAPLPTPSYPTNMSFDPKYTNAGASAVPPSVAVQPSMYGRPAANSSSRPVHAHSVQRNTTFPLGQTGTALSVPLLPQPSGGHSGVGNAGAPAGPARGPTVGPLPRYPGRRGSGPGMPQ